MAGDELGKEADDIITQLQKGKNMTQSPKSKAFNALRKLVPELALACDEYTTDEVLEMCAKALTMLGEE